MFDTLNDDDRQLLVALHDSVDEAGRPTPVDQILARGLRLRRRRHLARAAAGTAMTAALAAAALATPWPGTPHRAAPTPAVRAVKPLDVELAGWSARTNPDSTLTITLRDPHLFDFTHPQLVDAERLRATLAGAGVPVDLQFYDLTMARGVTSIDCHIGPEAFELSRRVIVQNQVGQASWTITIRPADMPPGAVLQLFLAPDVGTTYNSSGEIIGHPYSWSTSAMVFPSAPPPCSLTASP